MKNAGKSLVCLTAALLISGCVAQAMQSFEDNDIRDVINYYGPPDQAFDTKEGLRAYQWKVKGPYITPPMSQAEQLAQGYETSPWFDPNQPLPLAEVNTELCMYTMLARYYPDQMMWHVERYRAPLAGCKEI